MTDMTPPTQTQALSPELTERLESLGVAVLWLDVAGRTTCQTKLDPIDDLITQSPDFTQAAQAHWHALWHGVDEPILLWPGLWLTPLGPRRKRRHHASPPRQMPVAMLLGPALLAGKPFQTICQHVGVDPAQVAAQIPRKRLLGAEEVRRLHAIMGYLEQDAREIQRRYREIQSLSQQLGESYEELSLLYKFSTNMSVNQSPSDFLTESCLELQQVMGLKWMALTLVEHEPRLNDLAGQVYAAGPAHPDADKLKRAGQVLIDQVVTDQRAMVIDDTGQCGAKQLQHLASQMLAVVLVRDTVPMGVLFGGDKIDGSAISSVDLKLCDSLASSLAIFLENTMLYDDMHGMFMGTLHALTNAIDAKDSYTHGHSERVAQLSQQLAASVGMDQHEVERVYVAGLLHDVGKIGVPEQVLCKPGKLTDQEFDLIKTHPEIGARILSDIRQMDDVIPGVLYHHERWDGRGYPFGLKAQQTPIMGRLIGLADSFDAMSSTRTYRSAMELSQVLAEIERCAGSQFDPDLASMFIQMDFDPFFELIAKHQALDSVRRSA